MKAIVTGGNRGIGLEISKMLVSRGFEVHILSRSGMNELQEGMVSWTVDVSDFEQVIQKAIKEQEDVLRATQKPFVLKASMDGVVRWVGKHRDEES